MKTTPRIIISFAAVILSLCIYACKDYIETPVIAEESAKGIFKSKGILPINLDKFNILANNETKSSFTDTVTFSLDSSMLNWGKASQVNRDNGLVFTQIPFSFNDSSVFAAISDDMETLDEYKVSLKSFYIKAEDCFNNVQIDYIVTMVPTREYQVHNVEYDFLNMQGYSGIVFYSDTIGRVFKINALKDGIINRVSLSKETEIDNPKYVGFYSNDRTITKSDQDPVFDGGELLTIVIYADSQNTGGYGDIIIIGKTPESDNQGEKPEEVIGHTDKLVLGGGTDTTALQNEYTLSVKFKGCCGESEQIIVAPIGNSISVTAKDFSSDTCIFMYWEGPNDILSNNRSISLTLSCNTTITAYYMGKSKGACFELAKIASDATMKANMKAIIDSTHLDSIEHGYMMRSDGSKLYGKGTDSTLRYDKESGQTYIQRFHTHPKGTKFCSGADIWTIYDMLRNQQIRDDDIDNFRYGMIARDTLNKGEHTIHIIKIVDKNKFENYFTPFIINSNNNFMSAGPEFIKYFNNLINDEIAYDDKMLTYVKALDNMGLSLSKGEYTNNASQNTSKVIYWSNVTTKSINGTEKPDFETCAYQYPNNH